ncbi:hypothetical protein [Methylobacterium oxalidis]|uniref:Uncharacterized protein n=2 Tax=Methylobacterium oxalidis TaxID=944322 RepID=A0A512J657_9HYPH|nr:hypothetical protein [Methylobacterium oxalidis]GEP05458.1 hypothetical protein MOX02_34960 [Methylobacterium oxalidis]GJE32855.1 hypothetical protein LDDCCGHA_3051 [Methylobacterium oxalidis]GLS63035.1 hypothetical protein GCM10007888_14160 [Methylobacterium oxalidis]
MVDDRPPTVDLLARADRAIATSRRLQAQAAALKDAARLILDAHCAALDEDLLAETTRSPARRRPDQA